MIARQALPDSRLPSCLMPIAEGILEPLFVRRLQDYGEVAERHHLLAISVDVAWTGARDWASMAAECATVRCSGQEQGTARGLNSFYRL